MKPSSRILAVATLALPIAVLSAATLAGPTLKSGPKVGESVTAYEPYHVTGADKGTFTCPVCKYGMLPNVQVWINNESDAKVEAIASKLEKAVDAHSAEKLHAFVVFLKPAGVSDDAEKAHLSKIAEKAGVHNVALLYTSANEDFVKPYRINTADSVHSTFLVTKRRVVIENLVNASVSDARIDKAIEQATH